MPLEGQVIASPAGSVPDWAIVGAAAPVVVTAKAEPAPTVKDVVAADVMVGGAVTGGELVTVSTNAWVAFGAVPFEAVNASGSYRSCRGPGCPTAPRRRT